MKTAPLLLLILVCAVTPAFAQATIRGRVIDKSEVTLHGVEITVTGTDYRRVVVTNPDGTYQVAGLAPGSYSVRAAPLGFCPVTRDNVPVMSGLVEVNFVLSVSGVPEVSWVMMAAPYEWRQADAVVHLRVDGIAGVKPWSETNCGTVTTPEYRATVLAIAKAHLTGSPTGNKFTFLQGHVNPGEPAYREGDEFVAFLNWNPAWNAFVRTGGPLKMYPVRDGRVDVRWERDLVTMKVEDFLAKLRALANER